MHCFFMKHCFLVVAQGKLTVKHEKVNLSRIVDDVLELTRPLVSVLGTLYGTANNMTVKLCW